MAIKTYRPYTPSRRSMTGYSFSELTVTEPYKPLTKWIKSHSWRNNQWRITSRFRWGGHKKLFRQVDRSQRDKLNIPATVSTVEYDPFRTAYISLVTYKDWEKRYMLARKGISVWQQIVYSDKATWDFEYGNRRPLKYIPEWMPVHNIEFTPHTKWKIIKSAWSSATVAGKDSALKIVFLKLASWELRKFNEECLATIGIVSNEEHKNIVIGKAWRQRWMWKKPFNRGKSMNPVDHPHGGWEWRTSIWLKYPKAFNGRIVAPGKKTRAKKKWSNVMIVKRRAKKS
jgi:large subunit ribosomal protein L2